MTGAQVVALVGGLFAFGVIVELVRRRQLREKYAVLWSVLGLGVGVLGLYPGLLDRVAAWLGIADPPNLLYFVALLVLLLVVVHLTWEISRLERETRTLAEEIALLRLEHDLETGEDGAEDPPVSPRGS